MIYWERVRTFRSVIMKNVSQTSHFSYNFRFYFLFNLILLTELYSAFVIRFRDEHKPKKIKNKKMTKKGRERNGKEKEEKNDKNIINRIETPM